LGLRSLKRSKLILRVLQLKRRIAQGLGVSRRWENHRRHGALRVTGSSQ
jgi:hypothetical protein